MTTEEMIAQYLKSHSVTKVPTGHRAHSEREMYLRTEATDHEVKEAVLEGEVDSTQGWTRRGGIRQSDAPIACGQDHMGRTIYKNAIGELVAVE